MTKQQALEALARAFSATREEATGPSGTVLTIGRKNIAVDVALAKRRPRDPNVPKKTRLRFDKVALRLVTRLQEALHDDVPAGETVIFTVTAPIRLASKTAAALESAVRELLARKSKKRELDDAICGNQIRVRIVGSGSSQAQASNVVGFVHNPDPNAAALLLDATQLLLECYGACTAGRARTKSQPADRWLLVVSDRDPSQIETYRQAYSQLGNPAGFNKVLVLLSDGSIESLTG